MATYAQLIELGPYFSGGNLCTIKVYHYAAGTTTLKDVYTDRGKTTTAAQPVPSDSNGIASFYADGLYKFRIDGSTDGLIYSTFYTYDNWAVVDQSLTLSGEGAAIASASTLTLGTDGNIFHVTGSTGPITALSGSQSQVTLIFDSTPTLTHSGSLILQYAVDYVAAANNVMTFFHEGSNVWREISRTPAFVDIAANGDLPVGSGNDTTSKLTVGTAGSILISRAASTNKLAYVAALNKTIYGLTYANNVADATNDIDFAAGGCMDATGAYFLVGSALTKQLDANWAVGTNQGMRSTGAIADTGYYLWIIGRSDTGVVDYLADVSSTAPTMPSSYDFKRLMGWINRVSGTIVAFHTYEREGGGLEFKWDVPTLDVDSAATLTTSRLLSAVKVPLNISTLAWLRVIIDDASLYTALVCCPDETDAAPSLTAAPGFNIRSQGAGVVNGAELFIRTSATGTIAARVAANTMDTYRVVTLGFTWERRN